MGMSPLGPGSTHTLSPHRHPPPHIPMKGKECKRNVVPPDKIPPKALVERGWCLCGVDRTGADQPYVASLLLPDSALLSRPSSRNPQRFLRTLVRLMKMYAKFPGRERIILLPLLRPGGKNRFRVSYSALHRVGAGVLSTRKSRFTSSTG